jgi:hypothetical protein
VETVAVVAGERFLDVSNATIRTATLWLDFSRYAV